MKNIFASTLISIVIGGNAFAQVAKIELQPGKSILVCKNDRSGYYRDSNADGQSDLNSLLLRNEFSVVLRPSDSSETTVVVKAPFVASSPAISKIKDDSFLLRYCVIVTKQ